MSRTISPGLLASLFSQETDDVPICLLTIEHEDLSAPIYLSNDPTTRVSDDPLVYVTESRGKEYVFLPFDFTFPDDKADSPPRVQLSMDNIDRQMVAMLRSFSTPPTVRMEIIMASSPDLVEIALPGLQLVNAQMDETKIASDLVADPLINEPFPAGSFTPGAFPGIF